MNLEITIPNWTSNCCFRFWQWSHRAFAANYLLISALSSFLRRWSRCRPCHQLPGGSKETSKNWLWKAQISSVRSTKKSSNWNQKVSLIQFSLRFFANIWENFSKSCNFTCLAALVFYFLRRRGEIHIRLVKSFCGQSEFCYFTTLFLHLVIYLTWDCLSSKTIPFGFKAIQSIKESVAYYLRF